MKHGVAYWMARLYLWIEDRLEDFVVLLGEVKWDQKEKRRKRD